MSNQRLHSRDFSIERYLGKAHTLSHFNGDGIKTSLSFAASTNSSPTDLSSLMACAFSCCFVYVESDVEKNSTSGKAQKVIKLDYINLISLRSKIP